MYQGIVKNVNTGRIEKKTKKFKSYKSAVSAVNKMRISPINHFRTVIQVKN